jgi:16S rRNA (guanine1207-N2)-methyltransferase
MSATPIPDPTPDDTGSHYFEDPSVESDPVIVDVTLPDTAFTMETDTGVFSRGHVDAGTSLLLRSDPTLASSGHLLDLGAGSGAMAMTMARRSPEATVWAVDVNARARDLCGRNAARNNLTNIRVAAPDEVPADLRFSTIWSNPPIRIGKPALRELLLTWLARLTDDGTATLVVQKHLGADSLQRWLIVEGHPTERVASKSGFRLLAVQPALTAPR